MKRLRRRFRRSEASIDAELYASLFERGRELEALEERYASEDSGRRERFRAMIELYRSTFDLPGETIEAGCLYGLSSFLICHYSRLRDPSFTGKGHHVVDSFYGLGEAHEADFGPQSHPIILELGKLAGQRERFRDRTERTLAEFPEVAFHEGWIPEVFATVPEARYRFVHVDVDLHDPTRACLEYFYPRLVENGVLVIDDYGYPQWPGCKAAADAFAAEHGVSIGELPSRNAVLVKRS